MGVTTLGATVNTPIGGAIVIKGVTPNAASTTQVTVNTATRTLLPKGAYTVFVSPNGDASFGSSPSSGSVRMANNLEWTVVTMYADNGRVGPVLHSGANASNPMANLLVLQKDAYVQVGIQNTATYTTQECDIIFTPTVSPFKSLGTITGNRTQVGDANATDTSNVNFGTMQLGWDYDRNAPLMLTSATYGVGSSQCTRLTDFYLWRYNSNGTWSYTYWNNATAATGNAFYNGSGLGVRGNQNKYRHSSLFIKSNYLHNLDFSGLMTNTASGLRWGWIKGDISAGTTTGSTLTLEPGHTNTAFATATSSISSAANNIMMYYHDTVNGKVIYNGAKSSSLYSGSTYWWIHHWAQWDIATNTVDYQNSNGNVNPEIAGSGTTLAYDYGLPDGTTGFTYAVGDNGGTYYNAKWNRTGTYTGVGSYQMRYPFAGTTNQSSYSFSQYAQYNRMTYLPNGVMVTGDGSTGSGVTVDYATSGINQPIMTMDRYGLLPDGLWALNSTMSTGQTRYPVLVTRNTIVFAQIAFAKYTNTEGSVARTAPITIFTAPATTSNLGAVSPGQGGRGSASTSSPTGNPGISNGV